MTDQTPKTQDTGLRAARRAGQIAVGLLVGALLVPSFLELALLIGDISAFKYQGF